VVAHLEAVADVGNDADVAEAALPANVLLSRGCGGPEKQGGGDYLLEHAPDYTAALAYTSGE
jgi:hypothetical protein